MHKILISHEIPKKIFGINQIINDYPYVLAHLLWENTKYYDEEYAHFYSNELKRSHYSILDNSCYELGSSIPREVLAEIYLKYKASFLVLPDVMGDVNATITQTQSFIKEINNSSINYMGVVQGTSKDEYIKCWDYYNEVDEIKIIGINYRTLRDSTRFSFLKEMYTKGKIIKNLHLLGCNNPIEFKKYLDSPFRSFISSVDTSSPIIHGWNLNYYDLETGVDFKPKELLADNLDRGININELECIIQNVRLFRFYVNG